MHSTSPSPLSLRDRIRARQRLVGTFVKTPSYHALEILGMAGLDFACIDAEHAPFGPAELDVCILAARAAGLPAIVRIPDSRAATVLAALDVGACGILAPHALDADHVQRVLGNARYQDGKRGLSNSPRAGRYGTSSLSEHAATADRDTVVMCQIEDMEALDEIDAIAAIGQLDCLFIGRADLAASAGIFDLADARVEQAVQRICRAGRDSGKAVGIFLNDLTQVAHYEALGASLFIIGSDQSMLRTQASAMAQHFHAMRSD
ncbi:MAG: aldolase/citrate lyase family protein [Pseudomonadota bacterium]